MVKRRKRKKKAVVKSTKRGMGASITPVLGPHIFFRKKPSAYNICIGNKLKGKKTSSRKAQKKAFKSAVAYCKKAKNR